MALKYGIIGTAPSRTAAPYQDTSWLMSGQNMFFDVPRYDWWFEVHNQGFMSTSPYWQQLWQWLTGKFEIPQGIDPSRVLPSPDGSKKIWMREAHPDIPGSVAYPRAEILKFLARISKDEKIEAEAAWTLTSTVALEMALAMYEIDQARAELRSQGGDKIGLWGVEMASETEYYMQKPGVRQLMQWARQMDIEVITPLGCNLLTIGPIYGLDDPPHMESLIEGELVRLNKHQAALMDTIREKDREIDMIEGATQLLDQIKGAGIDLAEIDKDVRRQYNEKIEKIRAEQKELLVEVQQGVGAKHTFEFCKNNWIR